MNKEVFKFIREELKYILILMAAGLAIFKIIYFNDSFAALLKIVASLFWLFVIPGYFAMLYWREKLEFAERIVIGVLASAAIIGISSYYFGLVGVNIKYHGILLPALIALAGLWAAIIKKSGSS